MRQVTVLIVEDSPTQAAALRFLLESEGYAVAEARDGEEALGRLRQGGIGIAVSDVMMPRMDGNALCEAVRADPALRDTPVLLLTSQDNPTDVVRALECGANGFMHKPYEPDRLLTRVSELLAVSASRAAGARDAARPFVFRGQPVAVDPTHEHVIDLFLCTLDELLYANAALKAKEVSLQATNRELESFSYSVSHDLRAPLRAIEGFSRIVLEDHGDSLDPRAHGHLLRVQAAAERMRQLIEALLGLAHVAKAAMKRVPTNLSQLADEIVRDLVAGDPDRAVTVRIAPDLDADGDPALLRALLENLLANAWKFTSAREDALIEVGVEQRPEGRVYFIRDNGAGFDMAHSGRLFGAFQRLHHDSEFPGTGVGLATVQRIAHRHGGHVWADAKPGEGATFYFTLA